MPYDPALADRIRKALLKKKGFVEKKMFGGVGFLLHGNMCVGIWKDSLVARLDVETYDAALHKPHVKKFDITGRPMTGWILVGPEALKSRQLQSWIQLATHFVATLPPK